MNSIDKLAGVLGAVAFCAALTNVSAKANCNSTDSVHATSANTWFQAADYCAGGGQYALLNYEAAYFPSFGSAATYTTSWGTSNNPGYQIATEVRCSNGGFYYSVPDFQGPYYAAGYESFAYCPYGSSALESWGFAYIKTP